jgi:predicted Zn-dependent protease
MEWVIAAAAGLIVIAFIVRRALKYRVPKEVPDPIAEADVYMAYGRNAQAIAILKNALKAQPDRQDFAEKLREIEGKR